MRYSSFIGLFCIGLFLNSVADAQSPSGVVRIGILNDQSGPYADFGGKTSVDAARMAVEDVGGKVLGKSIEIIIGDHQNRPDVASAIARRWFDVDGVGAVAELTNSAVALAVQQIAKEKGRSRCPRDRRQRGSPTRIARRRAFTGRSTRIRRRSAQPGPWSPRAARAGSYWLLTTPSGIKWPTILAKSSRRAAAPWSAKSGIRSTPATSHHFCYRRRVRKRKLSAWPVPAPIRSTR